jgi:alpha-1,3-rhamnosyl/mannosyltransferase
MPLRPSVMMLHDLSPWKDPLWQPSAERIRRRTPILLRLGLATMVVTPTQAIRKEAIERFHLDPDRVAAVPLAASPLFHPVEGAPDRPYFLFVGTLEPRKNIGCIVEAWRSVRQRRDVDLVIVGRRREDFPPVAPEPGLRMLNAVAEDALPPLYSGAAACLYPSFYEGFGLPVLEAMQCGAMVIASRDAAITEVAAGAALQLEAADSTAWAAAMEAVLNRPETTLEWRTKALERAAEFSWTRTAARTREIYDEARRRFGR